MANVETTAIMTKFYDGSVERPIDIPKEELKDASINDVLDLAFKYGQNDFQPRPICSVSVGDIIFIHDMDAPNHSWATPLGRMRMDRRFFRVEAVGFEEISLAMATQLADEASRNPQNIEMVARHNMNKAIADGEL